jgi:hypothetical protein
MKKCYKLFIAVAIIGMSFAKTTQGQTAYVSLDTIANNEIVKFCASDYNQVVIYKPTAATSGIEWQVINPTFQQIYTNSISLTAINNGAIGFISTQTGSIMFTLLIVGLPTVPNLLDVNVCGDVFSTTFNAQNIGIGANYLWSNGATTKNITVHQEGTYSVMVNNGCGIVHDTALIIGNHTNDANLGPDQSICLYDTITLTSINTNITAYAWSNAAITSTISISQPGSYIITTTDNTGCISIDTVAITVLTPYAQQELCMAYFDTITYQNRLSWTQNLGQRIDSIDIEKQISLTTWQSIGAVSNSVTTFLDVNSTPQTNSDSYRIIVVDSCGNRSAPSDAHTTITLLTSYTPGPNVMGFTWSNYLINGALVAPTYTIYGIDPSGNTQTIGTVPGNQNYYNWNTPNLSYIKFFVGFQLTCGAKTNYLVRSNYTGNPVTSINEQSMTDLIKIYPTLTTGPITIATELTIKDIKICSIQGQVLLTTKEKHIDIPYHGLLFVYITTDKGMMIQKIIVQ